MLIGIVEGNATSHVKHPSMEGWRLMIVQPQDLKGGPNGDPILAIDMLGAGRGSRVVISNDGRSVREMVGDRNSPVRWAIIGIVD
ncbi:MAG TPA: EutN/CcmL family microcompartment protein [Phycisphaerae bacterium]|nr:EutN/CcmL family microcompartment protein [Phycisphaerae bacterium]